MIIDMCNKICNYYHKLWDLRDTRLNHMPFMSSPLPLIIFIFGYLFMIRNGKKWMEHRQPMKINGILIAYNCVQMIGITAAFTLTMRYIFIVNKDFSMVCEPCKFGTDSHAMFEAYLTYAYFVGKSSHFLDTVFFILRKKWSQITFLHVYHHVMVVIAAYVCTLYAPGGHSIGFGCLNCFENFMMYLYYFVSIRKPMGIVPSATMKKNILRFQIALFYVMTIHYGHVAVIPGHDCGNKYFCSLGAILSAVMLVLYTGFYWRHAYGQKKETHKIE